VSDGLRFRRLIPLLIFLAVFLLGLALAWALLASGSAQRRLRLSADAEEIARSIEMRAAQNLTLLRAARALVEVDHDGMRRIDFQRFVSKIDLPSVYPGIQGVGFAALIETGQEAQAERRYAMPTAIHPSTDQSKRAPVTFIEPQDVRNRAALGYDMYSEPNRRAAMDEAARLDKAVASAPVRLRQEVDEDVQSGLLVYLPVRGASGDVFGFVYAPWRVGDLVRGSGVNETLKRYAVRIQDIANPSATTVFESNLVPDFQGSFIHRAATVFGREWRVSIADASGWPQGADLARSLAVAVLSLILATLVAHSYRDQQRARDVERALSEERLKALADREVLLQEMNHRIKNAIARISAIARSSSRGATSLEDFQKSFSGRLAAMAAAQDLVTKTNAGASLRAILQAELGQIFPDGDDRISMTGPPVDLTARQTQALALIVHELATNAAKHGAARDPSGRLDVSWSRVGEDGLTLLWNERCPVVAPPVERKGFGSRLIQMTVEGELAGRLTREIGPDGLSLRIDLPAAPD
jgi:CHASE1-domain containing sensor protein